MIALARRLVRRLCCLGRRGGGAVVLSRSARQPTTAFDHPSPEEDAALTMATLTQVSDQREKSGHARRESHVVMARLGAVVTPPRPHVV